MFREIIGNGFFKLLGFKNVLGGGMPLDSQTLPPSLITFQYPTLRPKFSARAVLKLFFCACNFKILRYAPGSIFFGQEIVILSFTIYSFTLKKGSIAQKEV